MLRVTRLHLLLACAACDRQKTCEEGQKKAAQNVKDIEGVQKLIAAKSPDVTKALTRGNVGITSGQATVQSMTTHPFP